MGKGCRHFFNRSDNIDVFCGERERHIAVFFLNARAEKSCELFQSFLVSDVAVRNDDDFVADGADRVVTVADRRQNLCAFGVRGCTDKDLESFGIVLLTRGYPVVAEFKRNARALFDELSDLNCGGNGNVARGKLLGAHY